MEAEYEHIRQEQFFLKHYGKLTLFEQVMLTAEDRRWWVERLKEEHKKQEEANKANSTSKGYGGSEFK